MPPLHLTGERAPAAIVAVDRLVGEYRESSDSRWLALAYLAGQCTVEDVSIAAEALLRDGGASAAHGRAAGELADLIALGICKD